MRRRGILFSGYAQLDAFPAVGGEHSSGSTPGKAFNRILEVTVRSRL